MKFLSINIGEVSEIITLKDFYLILGVMECYKVIKKYSLHHFLLSCLDCYVIRDV